MRDDFKAVLTELFGQLADNRYSLIVKIFYFKKESRNRIFYGQIFPVKTGENYKEETIEYEDYAFIQEIIPPYEVKDWFQEFWPREQSIGGGETETILKCGSIEFVSPSKPLVKQNSTTLRGYREIKSISAFPFIFSIEFSEKAGLASTRISLNSSNQPYFPQVDNLILNKYGLDIVKNNAFQNTLHILVFSIKGYIEGIITEENRNLIVVKRFTEDPLILKIYREFIQGNNDTRDYSGLGETSKISIPSDVKKIDLVLVDREGTFLDHKQYDFEKLTPMEDVEKLILAGEGVKVDFKFWESFPLKKDKKSKENMRNKYAKLMCAFANTHGGHILFGVNDEAEIVGIEENELDDIEKFLQEINDRWIKPVITITRSEVALKDGLVGVINIAKSDTIVMNLINKHYYIRRGSTNRVMYPEEMNKTENVRLSW